MSKKIVKSDKYEINKPSELCQVMYFEDKKKGVVANFSAIEIDMVNYILYKSREYVIKSSDDFNPERIFQLELPLSDMVGTFGKYQNTSYEPLIKNLRNLRSKEVVINALGKNKDIDIEYTSIIHKVIVSKHRDKRLKCVRVQVDTALVELMLDVKQKFSKMFLEIQYGFSLKYSKLLYEIIKDYIGIKQISINYDLLLGLLNIKNVDRYSKYSYFNGEILKPSVKEINEQSDIMIDYDIEKGRINGGRLQVIKIKFMMKSQPKSRLKELGLIEESITTHKFYNKSKSKLQKLVNNGYTVIDEEMWIKTDINKNEERYESENKIDVFLKENDKESKNSVYELLAQEIDACDEPMISIEEYKIIGVYSKDAFTRNPQETVELLYHIVNSNDLS